MDIVQVDILNPKAKQLLQSLTDLKLISIREISDDGSMDVVNRIIAKTKGNPPSLQEVTKEVESVRSKRYAKKGSQTHH